MDEKVKSGAYYDNCKEKQASKYALDEQMQKELWRISEELVGLKQQQ